MTTLRERVKIIWKCHFFTDSYAAVRACLQYTDDLGLHLKPVELTAKVFKVAAVQTVHHTIIGIHSAGCRKCFFF